MTWQCQRHDTHIHVDLYRHLHAWMRKAGYVHTHVITCACSVNGMPFSCQCTNKGWSQKVGNAISGFAGRLYVSNTGVRVWLTLIPSLGPALVSAAVALTWRHRRRPHPFIMRGCNIIRDWQPRMLLWKSAEMYRGMNGHTLVIWSTMTSFLHELQSFHLSFFMSFLAFCYQLHDSRLALMVFLQPSRKTEESHKGCYLSAWS